jgi:SNF family Na+-dependent transporter
VEASVTALHDSRKFSHIKQWQVAGVVCATGGLLGGFYSTNLGLYLLDIVDYFINNVAMLLVGLMEGIAAGWIYGIKQQKEKLGDSAVHVFAASWMLGTVIFTVLAHEVSTGIGLLVGILIYIIGSGIAIKIAKVEPKEAAKELFLGNIEPLREDLNAVVCGNGGWKIPFVWSLCIKFFLPIVLIVMFSLTIAANFRAPYGNYTPDYQAIGLVVALVGLGTMCLSFVAPDLFEPWMPPESQKRVALGHEEAGKEMVKLVGGSP